MELSKRIALPLVSLLAAIGIAAAVPAASAVADEGIQPYTSADQYYAFSFTYFGDTHYSGSAAKDDATSAYVWGATNTVSGGTHLYIDGYDPYSGWSNQTVNGYAYLAQGDTTRYRVRNLVYENGMRTARLRGMASGSGTLAGEWSADSTIANPWLN